MAWKRAAVAVACLVLLCLGYSQLLASASSPRPLSAPPTLKAVANKASVQLTEQGSAESAEDRSAPSLYVPAIAEGFATFDPAILHAGQQETFRLVYTVGPGGLAQGSRIIVQDPDFHGMGWTMFQRFQVTDGASPGYLRASTTGAGVVLALARVEPASVNQMSYSIITVENGSLIEGQTVSLTYGDISVSANGAATSPHRAYRKVSWNVSVDSDADEVFESLAEQPRLDISADGTPEYMFATARTFVQQGESLELTVRVLDRWGNPCAAYSETLHLSSTDPAALLPASASFGAGTGVARFSITLNTTGIHYIFVRDNGRFDINANPIVVLEEEPAEQLFWGDLHGHHGYVSNETLSISPTVVVRTDEYLEYARDVSDLDFACESGKSSVYWNVPQAQAEIAASILQYETDDFVPFRGYEWMGQQSLGEGHHNVYFLAATVPLYSPDDPRTDKLDDLYRALADDGIEALVSPHAPSYTGHNWSRFLAAELNARFRRQAEIYSHWDLSEELDPGSVRAGWVAGNRMGVIASTDGHFGLPGLPIGDVCTGGTAGGPTCTEGFTAAGGLTAVRAPDLTRQALWQGLKMRHTYATDGMRIFLDFQADGHPMGEQYTASSAPHLAGTVAGTANLASVQVFRGTYAADPENPGSTDDYYTTVYTATPNALTWSFAVDDLGFQRDCFYYLRVSQVDGRRAWSSPIWVDAGSPPLDLWANCGNGRLDPGENLATCPEDSQIRQSSQRVVQDGRPRLLANSVAIPLTGLYVYNFGNVESYVPYGSESWLEFMKRQVDRVKFAGAQYLAFNSHGMGLYVGEGYPSAAQMDDPENWELDWEVDVFDYAAQQGVYVIPTLQTDAPPSWWLEDHAGELQTDDEGAVWGRASFNNPDYWLWADALLARYVQRFRDHPALLAWDVRVGEGENNYAPPYVQDVFNPPDTWCDYSEQARSNFRDWLSAKYGTDAALQSAWLSPTVTLASAQIPLPMDEVSPSSTTEVLPYVNGPGDSRPAFYDWNRFRLEEKTAEMAHFGQLLRSLDPEHVVIGDPAYVPLSAGNRLRWGSLDGETLYRSPYVDAVFQQPRFGHTDDPGSFTVARSRLYLTSQYALLHGKLAGWAKEETSEVIDPSGDQENVWRLDSATALQAALGQGDGWVTGSVTDTMLPAWSDNERAEMGRLSGWFTAPGLGSPRPRIAVLSDPFDAFDYFVTGPVAAPHLRGTDQSTFAETLWANGAPFDVLTVDDVLLDPLRLTDYAAILVVNLPRLPLQVAQHLAEYRDNGGGLFIGGRTGILSELGRPDRSALETLLGATIIAEHTADLESWSFDNVSDPLLVGLAGSRYADDNLYYVPAFNLASAGYKAIAHLDGAPMVATVGQKGKTVFWFPRLMTAAPQDLPTFLRNLWRFFGFEPVVTAINQVEWAGDNYLSVFSPVSQTLRISYPQTMSGALVWDWNAMAAVGHVPSGARPEVTMSVATNSVLFLGTCQPDEGPQLVAVSGASLAMAEYRPADSSFVASLYRAAPGMQVQVAVHPGNLELTGVQMQGAGLDHAGYEQSGTVYVIQLTPIEERVSVVLQVGAAPDVTPTPTPTRTPTLTPSDGGRVYLPAVRK